MKRAIARAAAMAMPQEATTPKAWRKRAKKTGSGILINELIVFLHNTKLALLLATKAASTRAESVDSRVKIMKAHAKIAFCVMKASTGDQ